MKHGFVHLHCAWHALYLRWKPFYCWYTWVYMPYSHENDEKKSIKSVSLWMFGGVWKAADPYFIRLVFIFKIIGHAFATLISVVVCAWTERIQYMMFKCVDIKMIRCSVKIKYSWKNALVRGDSNDFVSCVCVCFFSFVYPFFCGALFHSLNPMPQESRCGKINDSNRISPERYSISISCDCMRLSYKHINCCIIRFQVNQKWNVKDGGKDTVKR